MIALANFELWTLAFQIILKTQYTVGNRLKKRMCAEGRKTDPLKIFRRHLTVSWTTQCGSPYWLLLKVSQGWEGQNLPPYPHLHPPHPPLPPPTQSPSSGCFSVMTSSLRTDSSLPTVHDPLLRLVWFLYLHVKLNPIPDQCVFSSILQPAMAAAAEPEERPAREDRGHGGARRVCLIHSDKLLETSEKNPRFAGRVSLRDLRCIRQTVIWCFSLCREN